MSSFMTGEGILEEGRVIVRDREYASFLKERGYGVLEGEELELLPEEALYLSEDKRLKIKDKDTGEEAGFQSLAERFIRERPELWIRYLIYRDLRKKGYVVKDGYGLGLDFLVYERGSFGKEPAKFLVLGLSEGETLKLEGLLETLRMAMGSKKELILAVVESRGDVVYYAVSYVGF
ncbi:tRNA-intron lyase [Candidatus Bathyarchaeota archaeon]|nr:tRNA-intron lyase [Candidatus Bathyarchaeota archaeon]MBS7627440.1 tRNA-intron lyase [Candidatus Bathyarchaeota archaeon]